MNTDSNNHHIAITIEALGSQPVHHIDLAVTAGALQDVREVDPGYCPGGPVATPVPTYTQAMSDAGELPPVGCECLYTLKRERNKTWFECVVNYFGTRKVVYTNNHGQELCVGISEIEFKPLDSRIDEDKAMQDIWDCYRDSQNVKGEYPSITYKILDAIKADKIHGVKWVGK